MAAHIGKLLLLTLVLAALVFLGWRRYLHDDLEQWSIPERAAYDLQCDRSAVVVVQDGLRFRASGCGRTQSYVCRTGHVTDDSIRGAGLTCDRE